ncbi:MAG: hypothetical protein FJ276_31520 [Planctomycetes bacterium]|nr:hypothetical protein [Planctomycetota bacterium]
MNVGKTASGAAIGAAVGSLLPGLGTIIGGAIGAWIGRQADAADEEMENQLQIVVATLAPFVAAANAGGHTSSLRRKRLDVTTAAWFPDLNATARKAILRQFPAVGMDASSAGAIFSTMPDAPTAMHYALRMLSILYADRPLSEVDTNWLMEVAGASGMPVEFWQTALGYYERSDTLPVSADRQAALEQLGLPVDATSDDIKVAYRNAAATYHPDRLAQVPDAVRRLAEDKMKLINQSYGVLRRSGSQCDSPFDGLFAADSSGKVIDAARLAAGHTLLCLVCGQKNRLPSTEKWIQSRCGICSALLLLPKSILSDSGPSARKGRTRAKRPSPSSTASRRTPTKSAAKRRR